MKEPKWIPFNKDKPPKDGIYWVMNSRGGEGEFLSLYDSNIKVFKQYDPRAYNHPCIDVTHYYPLPYAFCE